MINVSFEHALHNLFNPIFYLISAGIYDLFVILPSN